MDGPLTDETGMIAGTVADIAGPAEWALRKAIEVWNHMGFANFPRKTDQDALATALEAADKAATERERERAAKIAEEYRVWPSSFTCHRAAGTIAATIRKGGG